MKSFKERLNYRLFPQLTKNYILCVFDLLQPIFLTKAPEVPLNSFVVVHSVHIANAGI